jgi:ABC-2 type transport system permease protein
MPEIARRALGDRRRSTIWWSIGVALYSGVIVASYPAVRDQEEQLNQFANEFSPEMMALVTGGDASMDFTSPAGYVNSQLTGLILPILLVILGVGFASSTTAGEEDAGLLDLTLSYPISRRSVLLQKLAVLVVLVTIVAGVCLATVMAAGVAVDLSLDAGNVAGALVVQTLLGVLFGALAMALATATGSKGLAAGVAAGFAGATYLIGALAPVVSWLEPLRWISPFHYATADNPLANGISLADVVVLTVAALAFAAASLWCFERRDLHA